MEVNGTVAYAAQSAWILNATVRENVLFGRPYDKRKFKDVLQVCALDKDLLLLPGGAECEV